MDNRLIIFFGIGLIIGLLLYERFLVPDIKTKVESMETIRTDTIYTVVRDTIYRDKFKYIYERDTIIEDYKPKIRGFKETYSTLYGNVSINGQVLGELNYMTFTSDLRMPQINNVITKEKTNTIVIKPKGFYLTGGISNQFSYSFGAIYLNNNSLIGYEFQPLTSSHHAKIGWRVF